MHTWEVLLEKAIKVLNQTPIQFCDWAVGGGTVLMMRHQHRLSNDIDIFFQDPQLLSFVSPRLNDALEAELGDYSESSTFIRMVLEVGEIDFICAPSVTGEDVSVLRFHGQDVLLESSVEIVAKKLVYRSSDFTPRDAYDLAVVLTHCGGEKLKDVCMQHPEKAEAFIRRIKTMEETQILQSGLEMLDILPGGEAAKNECIDLTLNFAEEVLRDINDDGQKP